MSSSWIQRDCGHDLAPFTKADVGGLQGNTSAVWTQYGTLSCALEFQLLCQLAGLKRAYCCPSCRVHSHVIIAYSTLKHHLATGQLPRHMLTLRSLSWPCPVWEATIPENISHFSNIARKLAYKHQETLTSNRPWSIHLAREPTACFTSRHFLIFLESLSTVCQRSCSHCSLPLQQSQQAAQRQAGGSRLCHCVKSPGTMLDGIGLALASAAQLASRSISRYSRSTLSVKV